MWLRGLVANALILQPFAQYQHLLVVSADDDFTTKTDLRNKLKAFADSIGSYELSGHLSSSSKAGATVTGRTLALEPPAEVIKVLRSRLTGFLDLIPYKFMVICGPNTYIHKRRDKNEMFTHHRTTTAIENKQQDKSAAPKSPVFEFTVEKVKSSIKKEHAEILAGVTTDHLETHMLHKLGWTAHTFQPMTTAAGAMAHASFPELSDQVHLGKLAQLDLRGLLTLFGHRDLSAMTSFQLPQRLAAEVIASGGAANNLVETMKSKITDVSKHKMSLEETWAVEVFRAAWDQTWFRLTRSVSNAAGAAVPTLPAKLLFKTEADLAVHTTVIAGNGDAGAAPSKPKKKKKPEEKPPEPEPEPEDDDDGDGGGFDSGGGAGSAPSPPSDAVYLDLLKSEPLMPATLAAFSGYLSNVLGKISTILKIKLHKTDPASIRQLQNKINHTQEEMVKEYSMLAFWFKKKPLDDVDTSPYVNIHAYYGSFDDLKTDKREDEAVLALCRLLYAYEHRNDPHEDYTEEEIRARWSEWFGEATSGLQALESTLTDSNFDESLMQFLQSYYESFKDKNKRDPTALKLLEAYATHRLGGVPLFTQAAPAAGSITLPLSASVTLARLGIRLV